MILEKLQKSITALMSSRINAFQAFMHFNMYMVCSMYFGCCAIDLNMIKYDELRKACKIVMVKKLNLEATFPRRLLYARHTAIGVGLLQPHIIVAMATLKQYISNIRLMYNIEQMIIKIEELIVIKIGYGDKCIDFIPERQYWKKMWIDNVNEYLKSRNLLIINLHNSYSIIS